MNKYFEPVFNTAGAMLEDFQQPAGYWQRLAPDRLTEYIVPATDSSQG